MEILKKTQALLKKNVYFVILSLIFFAGLIIFWGRFGDLIIDCGREAYIPYAMADLGKILFKDIICIYGPVPYYINASIVKVFGSSLNTMQTIGAVCAYIFISLIFLFSMRFFGAFSAFWISLLILFSCVFSVHIFNFIFPYSYAMLYALVFALLHLFFIFKFIETNNVRFLYLSAFLLSCSLLSKYDFLPCIAILPLTAFLYRKNLNKKTILYSVLCFFIPVFFLLMILISQGVSASDILFNFKMISNMAHSPSLEIFYKNQAGFYFVPKKMLSLIIPSIITFLKAMVIFALGFFFCKAENKAVKYGILTAYILLYLFYLKSFYPVFFYAPLIIFLFFISITLIYLFKKNFTELSLLEIEKYLFIFFTVLISLKVLLVLNLDVYGTFYLPCVLISLFLAGGCIFKRYSNCYISGINFLSILFTLFFLCYLITIFFFAKNVPVKSPAGTIYSLSNIAKPSISMLEFIQNNLKDNDDFLILPEGLFFNFALKKEYKHFNTSFIPLDFDAYGEDFLTNSVLKNLPKYLFVTNRDTTEYGKAYICRDYGQKFCAALSNMYIFRQRFYDEKSSSAFEVNVFERVVDVKD